MATKGCSKLKTVFDLWNGLEDIHEQVNQQNIRLFRLLQLDSSDILSQLVILLLKYYDCDSSTFIFNGHSFAVTLEDILYITGLPIQGIPIMDDPNDKNAISSIAYFPISKLKDRAKDTSVDPITRMKAALLVLIACFVIPTCKSDINGNFVKYVDRLDNVDNYAWGAALLAFLQDGIVKWKTAEDKKYLINGNLWIVLAVFLIRIPKLSQAIGIELDLENAEVPLLHSIVKVVKPISHNHNVKYLNKVINILDTLSEDDIRWVPYKQYELPGILKDQEKYKLLLSPICCMDSIVHHRPHLAPRQFDELEHLDLSKLTWQETDPNFFFITELAQWNDGKLVTDFLPGYEVEGVNRHNEETSISGDADALEYENPNHSDFLPGYEEESLSRHNEETFISRDAVAFEYENPNNSDFLTGYEEEGLSRHNEETSISRDAVALEYENPNHSDLLRGYEEEGLSRHNEETSISRDAVALEYEYPNHSESREIPLDTSMQIIHSLPNCYEVLMFDPSHNSISSAAAFGYANAHSSESCENGTDHSELDQNGANHSKFDKNCANHSELGANGAIKSPRGMLINPPQKFNPSGNPNKKKRKVFQRP